MFEFQLIEVNMIFKVMFALVLGSFIGLERKGGPRGAGVRTFSLICMGAALFTVLAIVRFLDADSSRMIANIMTGIGFIGAGVIWRQKGDMVHGITTAAAIWVAAAVGVGVGLGYYLLATGVAVVTMIVLSKGHPIKEIKENIHGLC